LLDNLSILDINDLLLNVGGVLKNDALDLGKGVDGDSALSDVFIDREGEPIVIIDSLIHSLVQL